jgi:hypothetical protein
MDRATQDDRNGRHQQAALPGEGDSNKAMVDSLLLSSPGEEEDIRSKVPSQAADDGLRSRRKRIRYDTQDDCTATQKEWVRKESIQRISLRSRIQYVRYTCLSLDPQDSNNAFL